MKKILFCIALLTPVSVLALGRDIDLVTLMKYSPDAIDRVFLCSEWESGGHSGKFRITHAMLNAQSLLYIDWFSVDEESGTYEAVAHVSIHELNNDHAGIVLEDITCRISDDGTVVFAEAHSGHDETLRRVEVIVTNQLGEYELRTISDLQ